MTRWPTGDPPDEEEEELEGEWELDPNDPSHPDYDLSLAAGYGDWDPAPTTFLARRTIVVIIVLAVVVVLIAIPMFRLF